MSWPWPSWACSSARSLRSDQVSYTILFKESVSGLRPGSLVTLNGVDIGQVEAIDVDPKDVEQVAVTVAVRPEVPLKQDTRAFIEFQGVTGLKFIDLRGGTQASAPLPPGGTIEAGQGLLSKLTDSAQTMTEDASAITTNIERMVSQENAARIERILQKSEELVDNLNLVSKELATTMVTTRTLLDRNAEAIDRTLQNAAVVSAEMAPLMREMNLTFAAGRKSIEGAKLDQLFAGLDQTNSVLRTRLEQVDMASFTRSINTFQLFLLELIRLFTQNQDHVRAMFLNARQTTGNVKALSRDLREDPSRLIFSDKPEERDLP